MTDDDPDADYDFVTQEQALLEVIAALVEPLTRFDRTSFTNVTYAKEAATATARQRWQAAFRVEAVTGKGPLPSDVRAFADGTNVRAHLAAAEQRERRALPGRLDAWRTGHGAAPLDRLSSADCMPPEPPAGCAWACGSCGASGKVTCGTCGGRGRVTCSGCGGRGQKDCSVCYGSGRQRCAGCQGAGSTQQQRMRQVYAPNSQGISELRTEYYYEQVPCTGCGGSGSNSCFPCAGTGTETCHACGATGVVNCATCGASGQVPCPACAATGWHHEVVRLLCSVAETFTVTPSSAIEEVRATLSRCATVAELSELSYVRTSASMSEATSVSREFHASVQVTVASFSAAGRSYQIVGYGTPPVVRDFKNLVGGLLEGDLAALETAVRASGRLALHPDTSLSPALQGFFASEANLAIASNTLARQPEKRPPDDLHGAVSKEYSARAAAAIRTGLSRILWSGAAIAIAAFLLLPVALYLGLWLSLSEELFVAPLAAAAAAAAVAAVVLDIRARRRVREAAGAALADRMLAGLHTSGALTRFRLTVAACALGGVVGGWIAAIVVYVVLRRPDIAGG